jgi:hypothetical protein
MPKLDHAASLTSSDVASKQKATLQQRTTNRKSINTGYNVFFLRRKVARPLLEALIGRGENVRQLREIERVLREELQPVGILGELLFDRAWSSYLRCLLIVRTETRVLTVDGPPSKLPFIPSLPVKEYPFSFDDISFLHLQQLALIQRYDAYFSRDFFRATGLLMAMRDGGKAGLTRQLEKTFGKWL